MKSPEVQNPGNPSVPSLNSRASLPPQSCERATSARFDHPALPRRRFDRLRPSDCVDRRCHRFRRRPWAHAPRRHGRLCLRCDHRHPHRRRPPRMGMHPPVQNHRNLHARLHPRRAHHPRHPKVKRVAHHPARPSAPPTGTRSAHRNATPRAQHRAHAPSLTFQNLLRGRLRLVARPRSTSTTTTICLLWLPSARAPVVCSWGSPWAFSSRVGSLLERGSLAIYPSPPRLALRPRPQTSLRNSRPHVVSHNRVRAVRSKKPATSSPVRSR